MIVTYLSDCSMLPDPLEYREAANGLPGGRREQLFRQKHSAVRKQNLGAGLLLNYGLRQAGYTKTGEIQSNRYGKPYIPQIPFNLSHSGKYVILSIRKNSGEADRLPEAALPWIGCDIEQIRPYDPKIASRFFTDKEYRNLEQTAGPDAQAELFIRYWTRKESVLKLTGLGLALPMDVFDVSADGRAVVDMQKAEAWYKDGREETHPERREAADILRKGRFYFREYRYDDYCITVCSTVEQFSGLHVVDYSSLESVLTVP